MPLNLSENVLCNAVARADRDAVTRTKNLICEVVRVVVALVTVLVRLPIVAFGVAWG